MPDNFEGADVAMAQRPTAKESGCSGIDEPDGRCAGVLASGLYQGVWEDEGGIGDALDADAEGIDHAKISQLCVFVSISSSRLSVGAPLMRLSPVSLCMGKSLKAKINPPRTFEGKAV